MMDISAFRAWLSREATRLSSAATPRSVEDEYQAVTAKSELKAIERVIARLDQERREQA